MLELSEEQLNNLNKDALVIIAASLQDQLRSMTQQLENANARLDDNNRQIELLTVYCILKIPTIAEGNPKSCMRIFPIIADAFGISLRPQ